MGGKLYSVACDVRYLKKNPVLNEYCQKYPQRVQPADAGRPVLPILVEFFCTKMWKELLQAAMNMEAENGKDDMSKVTSSSAQRLFGLFDSNGDGNIEVAELQTMASKFLGDAQSSKIIVAQMIAMMDSDSDNQINMQEFRAGISKLVTET